MIRFFSQPLIGYVKAIALVVACIGLTPSGARAAATTVTSLADDGGTGELRAAINSANTDAGGDTITFTSGLTGKITLTSALPQITASVTITGPGSSELAIDGAGKYRPFSINGLSATAAISGLTVQNGSDTSDSHGGAGLYVTAGTLNVTNCVVSGNTALGNGGGIFSAVGSTLTLANCTLTDNSAPEGGGMSSAGKATLTACTLSGNSATGGTGETVGGGLVSDGSATITNCTISGNTATGSTNIFGGGLAFGDTGTNTVTNCTISANSASSGGGLYVLGATVALVNCVVYGDTGGESGGTSFTATNCDIQGGLPSGVTDGGGNISTNPLLGALANNGGSTATMALGSGSPCYGAGTAKGAPTTDQRGLTRPTPPSIGAYDGAPPATVTISPTSAAAGAAAFTLTVTGSGFVAASVINFGTTALTTTLVSATTITASVPTTAIATGGIYAVTVTTPSTGTSAPATFVVTAKTSPVITLLLPATAGAGTGTFTLVVDGTGFLSNSTISFGGTTLTTALNASGALSATVPASAIATAGTLQVIVTTPGATGGISAPSTFTVTATTIPTISSITPTSVTVGFPAFILTVFGTGFTSSSTITVGNSSLATTQNADLSLSATVPASLVTTAETLSVSVTTPGATGGTSTAASLTVVPPTPTISSITPNVAPQGSASYAITIRGTNFTPNTTVTLGASPLAATFVSSLTLTAIIPRSQLTTVGTYAVIATTPGAVNPSIPLFFNVFKPIITLNGLSPAQATAGQDSDLTLAIYGTNFTLGAVVTFNNVKATATYISSTEIDAIIPQSDIATSGTYPIMVTNPVAAGSASSQTTFTVTVANIFPAGLAMISTPTSYVGTTLANVLGYSNPKLDWWDPSALAYDTIGSGDTTSFVPGKGFWADFPETATIAALGSQTTSNPFSTSLTAGWNMIGDPFLDEIPLTSLSVTLADGTTEGYYSALTGGVIDSPLYQYAKNPSRYILSGSLEPYVGYWINVTVDCTLVVSDP